MNQVQRLGFWSLPATKKQFVSETQSSQVLASLWCKFEPDRVEINAATTLPQPIKSKPQIYEQVSHDNPTASGVSLAWKRFYAYGKSIGGFYRAGVVNVWKNNSECNRLKKQFMMSDKVDHAGQSVALRIPRFNMLTHEMAQVIYMNRIENKTSNDISNVETKLIKHNQRPQDFDPGLFALTRSQYQLLNRTRKDFVKLPLFAVLFAIFVECTPLLCYAFPQITPSTCVLPSIVPRLWDTRGIEANSSLVSKELESGADLSSLASRTAYNMPAEQVKNMVRSLRLVSQYLPIGLYSDTTLRDRLQAHLNYLVVDNYYLCGLNRQGNIWDLSFEELVMACLERNLIEDLRLIYSEDRGVVSADLRARLARFLVDFKDYNIGYLTVRAHLSSIDSEKLIEWNSSP